MNDLATNQEFTEKIERFNKHFNSHLMSYPDDKEKIKFLKIVYNLSMLFKNPNKNLNKIKLFAIDNDIPSFLSDYYSIPLYIERDEDNYTIVELKLFPKPLDFTNKEGLVVFEQMPLDMMKTFASVVSVFAETYIHQIKKEAKSFETDFEKAFKDKAHYKSIIESLSKPEHGQYFEKTGNWRLTKGGNKAVAVVIFDELFKRGSFNDDIQNTIESKVALLKKWFGIDIGKKSSTLTRPHKKIITKLLPILNPSHKLHK